MKKHKKLAKLKGQDQFSYGFDLAWDNIQEITQDIDMEAGFLHCAMDQAFYSFGPKYMRKFINDMIKEEKKHNT